MWAKTAGHGTGHIQAAGQKSYQSRGHESAGLLQYDQGGSITLYGA